MPPQASSGNVGTDACSDLDGTPGPDVTLSGDAQVLNECVGELGEAVKQEGQTMLIPARPAREGPLEAATLRECRRRRRNGGGEGVSVSER
ncbi:hypothetical protein WMF30_05105 [Sorangium sp. So ce134]